PVAPHWPSILLHAPATSLTFTLSLRDALPISQIAVFGFVLAAWMVSLCLHEFGHAYLAYRSGDRSVASKGYLTLNPFKYSDAVLSFLIPVVFIMLGGIGRRRRLDRAARHPRAAAAQPDLGRGPAVERPVRGHARGAVQELRPPVPRRLLAG